jgi:hypothetical protein
MTAPGSLRWYVLSILLFALSLLAKAAFVPLPLVLAVLIWWRFGRIPRREWVRLSIMLLVSICFSIVTIYFQAHHVEQIGNDAGPILTRIVRAGWAAWFYLYKMLVPIGLSPIYPRWKVNAMNPAHCLPLVALVGALLATWATRKRGALALMVAGLLLLAPVMGLANLSFFRFSYVADQWTYPALVAFSIAVAFAISRLPQAAQIPVGVAIVLILLPLTWQRASKYHDTLALWEDAARKNSTSYAIYNNLAWAYIDAGRSDDALAAAQRAAQLAPDEPDVQQTLEAATRRVQIERTPLR